MNDIAIQCVYKAFGTTQVLRGMDLSVPHGSLTAVLGASGSGKTTLLRLLGGFDRIDRGTIRLGDAVVDGGNRFVPPEKRHIGYVPQDGALFPHLTVGKNVAFGMRGDRSPERVAKLLGTVGLETLAGRYPHELSGGQQQRVALARALAIKPGIVLMDEPFSGLDPALRASLRSEVRQTLKILGVTGLLVTHDQDEALSLADYVAVVRDGRIAQMGSPEELYASPIDAQLAQFLGDANLLRGRAEHGHVVTALGELLIRRCNVPLADGWPLVALVRPEQLELVVGSAEQGIRAYVMRCEYHGHDTVVTVRIDATEEEDVLRVRAAPRFAIEAGSAVTIRVIGDVVAWAAEGREAGSPAPAEPAGVGKPEVLDAGRVGSLDLSPQRLRRHVRPLD